MIDLFDPIEDARLAEIARIARKKKKRNQILIGIATIPIILLGGYVFNRLMADSPRHYQTPRDFETPSTPWTPFRKFAPATAAQFRLFESPTTSFAPNTTVAPTTTQKTDTTTITTLTPVKP
jgi:hypothetical protein